MALKIKHKAIDKYIACTIFGFVYDTRIIKAHWIDGITQKQAHKIKRYKNAKRKYKSKY